MFNLEHLVEVRTLGAVRVGWVDALKRIIWEHKRNNDRGRVLGMGGGEDKGLEQRELTKAKVVRKTHTEA